MVLTPRLDQRQSQSLVMTPQLQQAIKLLQLSNLELAEFVEKELEQNPLLERDDSDREAQLETAGAEAEALSDTAADGDGTEDGLAAVDFSNDTSAPTDGDMDVEVDNLYTNDSVSDVPDLGPEPALPITSAGGGSFDEDLPGFDQTLRQEVSLRESLLEQLGVDVADPVDRMIGVYLIDMLDEAGYLQGDLADAAHALGCSIERVEHTLGQLQHFDPPGIFARDLRECLALQLKDKDRFDPAMEALLENLELLAQRDFKTLMRLCGVDLEDLTDMVAEIRALQPKPALSFDDNVAQPVNPDVLLRAKPGGGWHIELNAETLPRVLVNNQYYSEVASVASTKKDKQYITEQYHSANWLVKSLHQRATTILKVATELVRQQDMFFTKGVQYLKPLVLRDIAEVIDMHESTVSRVTANKFISTPRGMFELKYFFTAAISSADGGEAYSAESVRYRIKTLIDGEPKAKILSDDRIVELLKNDGIDIARRTVAKYREAMGIPSSVQRRRQKASLV